jgi:hypothetical protein
MNIRNHSSQAAAERTRRTPVEVSAIADTDPANYTLAPRSDTSASSRDQAKTLLLRQYFVLALQLQCRRQIQLQAETTTMDNKALTKTNPWKAGVLGVGGAVIVLVAAGAVVAALYDDELPMLADTEVEQAAPQATAQAPARIEPVVALRPAQPAREDCGRYLSGAQRDNTKVVKDGLIGGAIGAGLGAAGGAIADGGSGAGKGAGIGGLVGSVAGALQSNEKERERLASAEYSYRECLARNAR